MQCFPNYFDQGTLCSKAHVWDLGSKKHALKITRLASCLRDLLYSAVSIPGEFRDESDTALSQASPLGRRMTLELR